MRQREHHMEVAYGQDFGLPLGKPVVALRFSRKPAPKLRTMSANSTGGRFILWLASPCGCSRRAKPRTESDRAGWRLHSGASGTDTDDDGMADIGMTEQCLDAAQAGAGLQQMGGETVAHRRCRHGGLPYGKRGRRPLRRRERPRGGRRRCRGTQTRPASANASIRAGCPVV